MNIYIETLGCLKNANDSQHMAGILEDAGHRIVEDLDKSDAVVVNTCGFINDAKVESIDCIIDMAKEGKVLVVSGCLSKRYGDELYEEMPEVDIFIGVNEYEELPRLLAEHKIGKRQKHICEYTGQMLDRTRKLEENPYSATLKISEGCDNRCTYCIIPYIRGPYRSRPQEEILEEAKRLAESGCKELILIAQDTTAYGKDLYGEYTLDKLLTELCKINGIEWIRLMYCYEERITDRLIDVMSREDKVCKYIDIPIQHGDDKILKAMGRKSTRTSIAKTVGKLRAAMPDIHIRTTLIVGFPGEGEAEFNQLLNFAEDLNPDRLGVFCYSPEEGTPAASMRGQVADDVKKRRKESLMLRQIDRSLEKNRDKIGSILEVMVEDLDENGYYVGRTEYDAPEIDNNVIFTGEGSFVSGEFLNVKITDAFDYDLIGEVADVDKGGIEHESTE